MSTINLLPADYVENRVRQRIVGVCAFLFAIEVVGVIGAWAVTERKTAYASQVSRQVDDSYAQAAQQIGRLQQLEVEKKTMLRKADVAEALVERVPRSTLLAVLTNALPAGASLTQIKLETQRKIAMPPPEKGDKGQGAPKTPEKKTKLTSEPRSETVMAPATVLLEIKGLAATDMEVARFIANLARCPLVRGVDLGYSQQRTIGADTLRDFQVKVELKPNADAIRLAAASDADPDTRANAGGR